ncbi:hypothetical protein [Acinetobacter bereziniae]|uniref:hypothetical protein n=1 Tax=Acinetobacter bereziniae TaxID=106648 RepID=UPI0012505B89|nr:hypothetical protein [Acinetobacter bereziniae]
MTSNIHIYINHQYIHHNQIFKWEKKRALVVLKKLGISTQMNDLVTFKQLILEKKIELGHERIKKLLNYELLFSDQIAKITARLSFGFRRFSCIEIFVEHAQAEQFVEWFEQCCIKNNEVAMLAVTPDHYLIQTHTDRQEVIETNGGSPLAAHFYIDYNDLSSLRSKIDPTYPFQISGVAHTRQGLAVGGVRHQFRNEPNGFRAKLLVEYPLLILPSIISGHQWHLASEFANWICAAYGWTFEE